MALAVLVDWTVVSAVPSGSFVTVNFVLSHTDTALTQTYTQSYPADLISQGVTDVMTIDQRATQVTASFLTLAKPLFDAFANTVRTKLEQNAVTAGLAGSSAVTTLSIFPLIGAKGEISI